ncbi:alpha-D-ribose 1-methylphosphonate 5-triphosphate diphosphatase [Roseibium aggregatum]|uniref:Alpha-D-ribose 1-methylphosphonate 5-triphosphate diphosphatase n=1 Tax=Roseibium aggregatum TaxID=187304 RepID=A0A926P464_9HYPH|nr:alpha-D-ribose 1-methylphosphonate 5-triphosphate diphosphatase [Roseibium aggregatum]MBD1549545.1 alpha-D-ribose 1-methylphosphonate 5-triphosphate diphosphatase [Roseibium aggregatum]
MNIAQNPNLTGGAAAVFKNARVVLAEEVVTGHIAVSAGRIVAIDTGAVPQGGIDLDGDYLLPGLVDIHTDHFEKHLYPRAHVRWDPVRAALAHDAQIIGGGITTVFDSLCVGATLKNPERREILGPMIDALETTRNAGMLRAEHLVHLRCEITDPESARLVEENIGRDIVRLVSVMEHLPGRRQSKDVEGYMQRRMADTGLPRTVVERDTQQLLNFSDEISAAVRPAVVRLAHDHGLPLLSHDDTDPEHIDLALSEGIAISEFPCSLEAARLARKNGMTTVGGAPNVLRGGSQSGNVAVADLMAERLVDILASDYVPRSLLDAVFLIAGAEHFEEDLPAAVRMASKTPAEAANLDDRGEIAISRRADLLQVGLHDGHPYLKTAWRLGER